MTTSAVGDEGDSHDWINYSFIKKRQIDLQLNLVGGEERFWLGPEGGVFSSYFRQGEKQIYKNWKAPPILDTEAFKIQPQSRNCICLTKERCLTSACGTASYLNIGRTIPLLDINKFAASFNLELPKDIKAAVYKSDNQITNIESESWDRETGLISVWISSTSNPTPTTTVFTPYKQFRKGKIVNDEYFGKTPTDRLIVKNGIIHFKIDGCFRSKLGVSVPRATNLCGSYDSSKGVLTILWCDISEDSLNYMNGRQGIQNDLYYGDVTNACNDRPVEDGFAMRSLYETETPSPDAELAPDESSTHTQKIIHIQGNDRQLGYIIKKLFRTNIYLAKTESQQENDINETLIIN